jgi:hypothetical protein
MASAERVIRGTVVEVEDLPDGDSDNLPDWWVATVQPRNTLRGPVQVEPLAVRVQGGPNPCCRQMPRLEPGREQLMFLFPDDVTGSPGRCRGSRNAGYYGSMSAQGAARCASCGVALVEACYVCPYCGAARVALTSAAEEKSALAELHAAVAHAMTEAGGEPGADAKARDRLLHTAFVPATPEILIDEALFCLQHFGDWTQGSTVAQARYRACLARLELHAVDDAAWEKKAEVLRRHLSDHRRRVGLGNVLLALLLVGLVAAIPLLIWAIVRLARSLF